MFTFDRKHLLGLAGALALSLGVAGTASAVPFSGAVTTAAGLYGDNSGISPLYGTTSRNGWFSADLYLSGGPANILVEYLGKEAGNTNTFNFLTASFTTSGGDGFNPAGIGASQTVLGVASGLLDFSFSTNSPAGSVQNGSNNIAVTPNFFVSFGDVGSDGTASGGQIAYLWLDDNNAIDDNHDDMVIRLTLDGGSFAIPLPAAAWLMFAGIGGLGVVARRRKSAKAA